MARLLPYVGSRTLPAITATTTVEAYSITALLSTAVKLDPNNLLASGPTVDVNGYTSVTLQNAGVARLLPDQQLTYTVPLVDIFGENLATVDTTDFAEWILWAKDAVPGIGTLISAGIVIGGTPTSGRIGIATGLEYNASGWRAMSWRNPGTGWVAGSTPGATNALTRGSFAQTTCTATTTQHFIASMPIDASGAIIPGSLGSSASGSGTYTGYSHAFIGFSWSSASGVNGSTVSAAVRGLFAKKVEIPGAI